MKGIPSKKGFRKKEASGVSQRLCSSHQATVQLLSKRSREPIDRDLKWRCSSQAGIASHALMPTETPMRPLCSGLQVIVADRPMARIRSRDSHLEPQSLKCCFRMEK